jgi:glycosyltransferase involved in cell wall biosynthesis
MKIMMICEFFDEGLDYQENFLAVAYHRLGHEVVVITSTTKSIFDFTLDASGASFEGGEFRTRTARIIRKPWRLNLLHKLKAFGGLGVLLERERPDLVYFHDVMPDMLGALPYMRRNPRARMIMDCHADRSNSGANLASRLILHGVIRKAILERVRPYLSKIFPVVPASRKFLKNWYGMRDDEMEILPLGVDLVPARAALARDGRARIRDALGIPDDGLAVFTGGKLGRLKRTEELFKAARALNDPRLHVIVVGKVGGLGGGDAYPGVLQAAAQGVANLHFVGWQDRDGVYDHLAASDVAVFPASQSVLWQQSLGMGLPLVVAEVIPGIPEIQDVSYMNGLGAIDVLDGNGDVAGQIVAVLRGFLADPELLRQRRQASFATAETILDYDKVAAQTLRFNAA